MSEEQHDSKQKGRQILESIVRALIKLIPVAGEAIDQATFGSKDAIENAELRAMIQDIYKIVLHVRERDALKVSHNIETILPQVFLTHQAQAIMSKLDDISPHTLDQLIRIMIQVQSNLPENSETLRTFKASIEYVQSQQRQVVEQLNHTKASLQKTEDLILQRLNRLEEMVLRKSSQYVSISYLDEIDKELDTLDFSYLEHTSQNLVHASRLIKSYKNILWAIDTRELIGYARAPFNPDLYSGFLDFLMQNLDQTLYLLPTKEWELRKLVEFMKLNLINGTNFEISSILRTIRNLFIAGKIGVWNNTSSVNYDPGDIEPFMYRLADSRRLNDPNIRIDAHVLAHISNYNGTDSTTKQRLGFITRSLSMLSIGQNQDFRNLQMDGCSLIVNPYTMAALIYTLKEERVTTLFDYAKQPANISAIREKLQKIRSLMFTGAGSGLEPIILEIREIRRSVFSLTQYAYRFHDKIADIQTTTYVDKSWSNSAQDFRETYKRIGEDTLSVLSDIESYLKPFRNASSENTN